MVTSKLTIEQQIQKARQRLDNLLAKSKGGKFDSAIKKHQQAMANIYADMKAATGKKRGVDADILSALAVAMGMKNVIVTKKTQSRQTDKKQ